ncbi:MAG TPA: SAM-dependent tRNA/rRNA cytosine-C5 methylase, partial [Armatimonadetes bacterium]|nr:SAM-dependent tRNA/rRNA cytosine-C5 methylase [Armatimonadota bacterium]
KKDIEFCSNLQKDLIESAIKSLKVDGVLVYSTCSLTPEENDHKPPHEIRKPW